MALVHGWWGHKMVQWLWEVVWSVLKKLNTDLLYDAARSLLSLYPKEPKTETQTLHTKFQSHIIHHRQKLKTGRVSIDR